MAYTIFDCGFGTGTGFGLGSGAKFGFDAVEAASSVVTAADPAARLETLLAGP